MLTKNKSSLKLFKICLLFVYLLGVLLPSTSLAAEKFSDVAGHWAEENINSWVDKDLIKGYEDGTFKPDNNTSRAEFMALVNRAYGFKEEAPVDFTDVSEESWYFSDVAKAVEAGYIAGYGDQTMKPENPISRQEVAVILGRLLDLEEPGESIVEEFEDYAIIADWSKARVNAAAANGYMIGYPDGTFGPEKYITRAEVVTTLIRAVGVLYNEAGVYGPEEGIEKISSNVTVTAAGVKLQNMEIAGDLYLSAAIGDGDAYLTNVTVEGRTIVAGGGEESIIFEDSNLGIVIMKKDDGKVRVVLTGKSSAVNVVVKTGGKIEIIGEEGSVAVVDIESDEELELAGNFDTVNIEKENAKVNLVEGTIKNLNIGKGATGATVRGEGDILRAFVSSDATIEKEPEEAYVKEGVTANIAGQEVEGDKTEEEMEEAKETVTVPEDDIPAGPVLPPVVRVRSISVSPETMILEVGETGKITATVNPANATNKRVSWTSSDESVATVDRNGVVTGVAGGIAAITVKSVAYPNVEATKRVIVGDLVVLEGDSIQEAIEKAENDDVIAVGQGTYYEQLVIDKPVKLFGPNAGIPGYSSQRGPDEAVITAPKEGDLDTSWDDKYTSVIVVNEPDVAIDGFRITGDNGNEANYLEYSIYADSAITGYKDNLTIKNNIVDCVGYIGLHVARTEGETKQGGIGGIEGVVIESNLVKDIHEQRDTYGFAIYVRGAAGSVKNNVVENSRIGIQVQPYYANGDGEVKNNTFSVYRLGIWFNCAKSGAGSWLFEGNTITSSEAPSELSQDKLANWDGIGIGVFHASDTGLPAVTFKENSIDGPGQDPERTIVGIHMMANYVEDDVKMTFEDNSVSGVGIGVYRASGNLDLDEVLENNTFPEGSQVIGKEIKVFVPAENTVYNKNTGEEYTCIQDAIGQTNDGDTILVGLGIYNESLAINKPLTLISTGRDVTAIAGNIVIGSSNVTIEGFTIDARRTFPVYDSAVLSQPATSGVVTVKNCKIYADRNGITLLGDQDAVIIDNQILSAASDERCTNGIQVGNLSDTVNEDINLTLSGNTIIGNEYLVYDSIWYSSGILLKTNGNVTAGSTTLDAGIRANAEDVFDLIMSNNILSDNDVSCWIFNPETGNTWKMEFGGKRYYVNQLTELVGYCESKIENSEEIGEGIYHGKYPLGSITAFQEAIDAAKAVLNDKDNYSSEQIEEEYDNLRSAKSVFEGSVYYQYPPTSVVITPAIVFQGETASLEIKLPDVTGEWVAVRVEMDDEQQGWYFVQDGGPNDMDVSANSSVILDIVGQGTNFTDPGEYTLTVYAANFEITDQAQLVLTQFNKETSVEIKEGPRLDEVYVGSQPVSGKALFDNFNDAVAAIEDGGIIYVQEGVHSININMSINKNITIEGLGDDPSDTVLKQGNGIGSVYIFNVGEGKSFSISNLTIDGNELNSNGIITSEGNLNIQDIVFQNNKVYTGRGIVIKKGNAVIDNFRLLGGIKSTGNGISISDGFAGTAEILNSSITGSARGINVGSSQATVTLSKNTISSSTIGVYVKTGATVNEIVSDASNIDEVENAIKTATIFESCGTDIQIQ